MNYVLNHVLAV